MVGLGVAFSEEGFAHVLAVGGETAAEAAMVASLRAGGARAAAAIHFLQVQPAGGHDLPQPLCGEGGKHAFGRATCALSGLGCIEAHEAVVRRADGDGVAIDDMDGGGRDGLGLHQPGEGGEHHQHRSGKGQTAEDGGRSERHAFVGLIGGAKRLASRSGLGCAGGLVGSGLRRDAFAVARRRMRGISEGRRAGGLG